MTQLLWKLGTQRLPVSTGESGSSSDGVPAAVCGEGQRRETAQAWGQRVGGCRPGRFSLCFCQDWAFLSHTPRYHLISVTLNPTSVFQNRGKIHI